MKVQTKVVVVLLVSIWLSACAGGLSVREVQSSPVSISFSYREGFETEREIAIEKSREHCQSYERRAELVGEKPVNNDRRRISFRCMQEEL